jgi:hypothetical protein
MKIQCNACGAAEARVLCCADEAALCAACDEQVHAANKPAGKHQRVPLLHNDDAPPVPKGCQVRSPPPPPLSSLLPRFWGGWEFQCSSQAIESSLQYIPRS